jgi:hypothetical protein
MIKLAFTIALLLSGTSLALHSRDEQGKLNVASPSIERFPPSAFPKLSKNIVKNLRARGCTIPQAGFNPKPNNVISGEFAKRGQTDWAVLCSRGGISSILVFWGGSVKSPAELAKAPDDAYWLGNNRDGFHYYRHIMVADREYILAHYKEYGRGEFIPPINHYGIDNGFLEKGSEVYYYNRGKWLLLPGAD